MRGFVSARWIHAADGLVEDGAIEIIGKEIGRIVRAGEPLPPDASVLSLGSVRLIPGLIDIHVHGWNMVDVTDASADELAQLPMELARHGVTSFVPTLVAASEDTIVRQAGRIGELRDRPPAGAAVLGVHLEGPWLAAERRGGHPAQWVRNPDRAEVRRILDRTGHVVRAVTFSPEVPDAPWLAETLAAAGVLPVMGHTNATYAQARRAIDAGARHVTHLYNAMLGFRDSPDEPGTIEPGVETAVYLDDRVTVELIPSLAFVPRPLFELAWRLKGPARMALVTDGGRGSGLPEGWTLEFADGRRARVAHDALRLAADDPIANGLLGNVDPLIRGLANVAGHVGTSAWELLPAVTATPARILGEQDRLGSLRPGMRADIVAVDERLQVRMTMVAGDVVHRSA